MSDSFEKFTGSADYVVSGELSSAVNVAIALEKPLLIKGEPGTGKTMLAQSVARALNMELIVWSVKSTTKAQDGLYLYDTVQRLYDAQFGEGDVKNIGSYIRPGKLGQAFASEKQVVLLIDEIDKADLEFPNDLLWELDRMEFYIPETRQTVRAKKRPIVIITSNAEKELPDAFLRRCIFHYIAFPGAEKMAEIVRVHYPDLEDRLLAEAMESFYRIRSVRDLQKKPGTSELLDWLQALVLAGIDPARLEAALPFPGVLLKKNQDIDLLNSQSHNH
ncbi:MAG: MoxR family ATPase [Clostridiales Family XIII bacterium]|jgi:MoxR-like ATPase|nr:MoxR family ATPase [Clostridiales Family XIII bacterium]